jgi:hypothetical protein
MSEPTTSVGLGAMADEKADNVETDTAEPKEILDPGLPLSEID